MLALPAAYAAPSELLAAGDEPAVPIPLQQPLGWEKLPAIPNSVGVAGPFVGVHEGVLLVAGGANFPDAVPWKGGKKVWHDAIYAMERGGAWKKVGTLPRPLAYGVSVSTPDGVLCIGGSDAEQCHSDVFLLQRDGTTKPLPSLPRPLAFMSGARVGETTYVAGGQEKMKDAHATRNFLAFDGKTWKELTFPGEPRVLAVAAAQNGRFHLFSGRNVAPGLATVFLRDSWAFDGENWTRLADVPSCVMAGTGIASGADHILVFGGADGRLFAKIFASEGDAKTQLLETHPGFRREILAYHTVTDTWTGAGTLPITSQVTTTAVRWGNDFVLPSGEIRPGIRTPDVWKGTFAPIGGFGALNYAVLAVYLLSLVAMGFYFSRRGKTTDDFFKAGGRVPWWAAGISIFGTQLSAITFMAIPAKTFATDWRYFTGNMTILLAAPFVIWIFLPFYRRLNVTTAYEYLELRFSAPVRLIGSLMFIFLQFGRIGVVLLLPSLALAVVTGVSVYVCIAVMGVLSILYTALGGIEAVIWTDVLQVFVLLAGALLCLVIIVTQVGDEWGTVLEAGKLRTFDFTLSVTAATFWVMLFGAFFAQFISYGTDQAVIQRYLTTKDEKAAARGIWLAGLLVVPASVLFFAMGTALFVFYKANPAALSPALEKTDMIFPFFIITQLPQGVSGLLIAALFAAAMSSLDSSMNSVATVVTTDFYRRFHPDASDKTCLALARWVTVVVGVAGTAFALAMAGWNIKSLWDQFGLIIGLFGSGLTGIFLLGIFTRRATTAGALAGLVVSGVVVLGAQELKVHPWFLPVPGILSCFAFGYLFSFVTRPKESIEGLTIYTRGERA